MTKGKEKKTHKKKWKMPQTKKIVKEKSKFEKFAVQEQQSKQKSKQHKDLLLLKLKTQQRVNRFKDQRLRDVIVKERSLQNKGSRKLGVKKSKFDLDLGDDDDAPAPALQLTHDGRPLQHVDDFKEQISDSDNDIDVPAEIVDQLHFANKNDNQGGDQEPQRRKSKKEIYEEIIKKSKDYKRAKMLQKEEDHELLENVDGSFPELAKLLQMRKKKDRSAEISKNADAFDRLALELMSDQRVYADLEKPKKADDQTQSNQAQNNKTKRRNKFNNDEALSDNSDDENNGDGTQFNDDELETRTKKEKPIMKHFRKIQNLNNYITKLKEVKSKKEKHSDVEDDLDHQEQDSLDDIDLDSGEADDDEDDDEDDDDDDEDDDEDDNSDDIEDDNSNDIEDLGDEEDDDDKEEDL